MNYDILVYGPLFCDLIFTALPKMPELGTETFAGESTVSVGGSAIVAVALHRLGARVGLIADLGTDPMSHMVSDMLDELGLDRSLIRVDNHPLPQVTVALSFPQDRAFVTRYVRPETPPDIRSLLAKAGARHLHVCGFLGLEETPHIADLVHEAGMSISMDPGWDDKALHEPYMKDVISKLDLFLPSRNELCAIFGIEDAQDALVQAADLMPDGIVVMKDGSRGATAWRGGVLEHAAALQVKPVDTTGAGDSFDAGFLYAFLNGLPLSSCLRHGNVCGALATTAAGGATAAPTLQEIQQWL